MINGDPLQRSYTPIIRMDLVRLFNLARDDREAFFANHQDWAALYQNRVLGTALCQGAAMHYTNPSVGINDFDVYTFYAAHPGRPWYAKRFKPVDYGDAKFGQSEISNPKYVGRRVDLMARALDVPPETDITTAITTAITTYLRGGRTATARHLAKKAVIILEPIDQLGVIGWPQPDRSS